MASQSVQVTKTDGTVTALNVAKIIRIIPSIADNGQKCKIFYHHAKLGMIILHSTDLAASLASNSSSLTAITNSAGSTEYINPDYIITQNPNAVGNLNTEIMVSDGGKGSMIVYSRETIGEIRSSIGDKVIYTVRVLEKATDQTVATSLGGAIEMPFSGSILSVAVYGEVAGITGTAQFDINKNGDSILSTPLTIDTAETSSRTAATPAVISVPDFVKGDKISFDQDTIQTTAGKGLTFDLIVTITSY